MKGAGTDFKVQRGNQHAALVGPVAVETADEILKMHVVVHWVASRYASITGCWLLIGIDEAWPAPVLRGLKQTCFRRTTRSEEHTSELQSRFDIVCRLL